MRVGRGWGKPGDKNPPPRHQHHESGTERSVKEYGLDVPQMWTSLILYNTLIDIGLDSRPT